MEKETKNYKVDFDEIGFSTEMSGSMILCTISFDDLKYTLKKDSVRGYSKSYYGTGWNRFVEQKHFNLEKEKSLVKELVCTVDYRKRMEEEKKNKQEHKL